MSSDDCKMDLKSIDANGFDDVERVGEDFGIGIFACVAYPGVRCRVLSVLFVSDDDDDDDDRKTLDSY